MDESLWRPEEVAAVRRVNRRALLAGGVIALVGLLAWLGGSPSLGVVLLVASIFALVLGGAEAMRRTQIGRRIG